MRASLVVLLIGIALTGCIGDEAEYQIEIRGVVFSVELANTPELREHGLMDREHLAERTGMLFAFDEPELRAFWMRDTLIPLSIAYLDSQLVIREIHDMEPLDESPISSRIEAHYALELNQGEFESHGVRVGDRIVPSDVLKWKLGLR